MWTKRLANATTFDSRSYRLSGDQIGAVCDALIRANRVRTATFSHRFDDQHRIADAIARLLSTSTTLETLTLDMNFDDPNTITLTRGIRENQSLKVLEIPRLYDGDFTPAFFDAISHHPRLEEFRISYGGSYSRLIASQTLRRISFRDFRYPDTYKIVNGSPSLETLDVTKCTLGLVQTRLIAQCIANHSRLRRLVYDENPIGNDGAVALATVIHHLQSLSLRRCEITDLERFAASIRTDNDITTELLLDDNPLNELRGLDLIVPRLRKLEKLSIEKTSTHQMGATFLARTIRNHPFIRDVNLGENLITNRGFVDVIEALMSRGLPCTAKFSQCALTSVGLDRLSWALAFADPDATLDLDVSRNYRIDCDSISRVVRSPKIRGLRANYARIGDGRLIARAVANNPNLETLLVNLSVISDVVDDDDDYAVVRVLDAVARHPRIERVGVRMLVHPIAHLDAIVSIIENNRRLKHIEFGTFGGSDARLLAAIWRSASLVDVVCNDQDTVDVVKESRAPDVLALLCLLSCVDVETGPLRAFARRAGDGALFISIAEALL
jgi:hypothetical protein